MLLKLMSEAFFAKIAVHGLRGLVDSTENKVDDKMVDALAEALGIEG